jgi:HD superfamily phosphodiesterase
MLKTERILKTEEALHREFENGRGFDYDWQRFYRYEHSMRVASIGAYIAREEGLDEEAMICACLLHDAAYFRGFPSTACMNFQCPLDFRILGSTGP